VSRFLLLIALLAAYAAAGLNLSRPSTASAFDPLEARGRHVELAIEEGRFAEALPVALDLQRAYEAEPVIAYWLTEIYRALDRPQQEAEAWQTFLRHGGSPEDACPALPDAYARAGDSDRALRELEQCVRVAPDDPERLIDLAEAQAGRHDVADAIATYEKAVAKDPNDRRILRQIERLSPGSGGL
jgi:tetratricopeptide (TPR) repeat protein